MTPEPDHAKTIFLRAIEGQSPENWEAYLDGACGDDVPLRSRVAALLRAHQEMGSFPEEAPAVARTIDMPAEPPNTAAPGTVIGPYKLLQQIGEGGMGVVYMAEQAAPVRRKVALKIIKPGMDTREVIARFEAERQALALMDHPNIAKVFDGGTTGEVRSAEFGMRNQGGQVKSIPDSEFRIPNSSSGRPYFVMELVRGVPITDYCDQNNLPVHERLELFVTVCHAVQHAHQKGIIHRDIKPSNVLVTLHDGRPVPKVIDFGVAKAIGQQLTDKTLFTQFAQMVGTPLYMSPEQAELTGLDIDTRGDIYSLGVMLYELLTGTTPFDSGRMKQAAMDEIRRMIREEDPPSPSTRLSSTAGEAQTAVAAHRHIDPKGLSRLVRGDLDWIVMKALEKDRNRRYETANGFAADVGRHLNDEPVEACPPSSAYRFRKFARRNRAALTMSSVVILAILLVVGSLGWIMRDRAAREEKVAQDRAAREVEVARDRTAREKEVARDWEAQRQLLGESAKRALDLSDEYLQQGKWQQALVEARRADSVMASGPAPDGLRERVAERLADLAMVMRLEEMRTTDLENPARWEPAAADKTYTPMFKEYGIDVEGLNAEQAGRQIGQRAVRLELALALDSWARVYMNEPERNPAKWKRLLGIARIADPDEWRGRVRDALERLDKQRLVELAKMPEAAKQPAATVDLLASALEVVKERESALALLRQAQNNNRDDFRINYLLARLLMDTHPDDAIRFGQAALALRPTSPGLLHNQAIALRRKGRVDEAIAACRESLSGRIWIGTQMLLGACLQEKDQLDEAVAEFSKAIEVEPRNAKAWSGRGRVYAALGQLDQALADYSKAIELDPKFAPAWFARGTGYLKLDQPDEALADFSESINLDPKDAKAWSNRGAVYKKLGQVDKAIANFSTAIELDPQNAGARHMLARCSVQLGRYQEALDGYLQLVELFPKAALPRNDLAWLLATCPEAKLRDPNRAVELARKAIALATAAEAGGHWNTLGAAFYRTGDGQAAIDALNKSIELRQGGDAFDYFFLAMSHWQLEHKDEARAWYDRGVTWTEKNRTILDKDEQHDEELHRFRAEAQELLK